MLLPERFYENYANSFEISSDDCIFIKAFELSKEDLKDMDGLYPTHIYLSKKFLEVEAHGPTRKLALSSIASLREIWTLSRP